MAVVAKWAALPDPPLDLCAEAAALCGALLAAPDSAAQDAGLQMVRSVLQRWGGYMQDTLDPRVVRTVRGLAGWGACVDGGSE